MSRHWRTSGSEFWLGKVDTAVYHLHRKVKMVKCFRQVKCTYFENRVAGIEPADTILQYIRKHDLQIYTEYCDSWEKYEQKINRELQENEAFEMIMMAPLYQCSAFHDLE